MPGRRVMHACDAIDPARAWRSDSGEQERLAALAPASASGHLLPSTGEGLPNQSHRAALPLSLLQRTGRRWTAAPSEGASTAKHALALSLLLLPHPGTPAHAPPTSRRTSPPTVKIK